MNPAASASSFLEGIVQGSEVPGVQYVVVDSSDTRFEFCGGWADIQQGIPLTSGSQLLAYSMTKTLTAAAILQLADQGKVCLDSSANVYIDINHYGAGVTIRQMLAHTSGIPNPNPLRWIHLADDRWDNADEETALMRVLADNAEPDARPGERYAYSNINYWLLGKVIERVSGLGYKEYMRQKVFAPLGITGKDMDFVMPPAPRGSKGYLARWSIMNLIKRFMIDDEVIGDYEEGGWLHIRGHYVNGAAYGGAVGNTRGFVRFLQDQLRSASVLFSRATKKTFFEQQKTSSGEVVAMTPGWHIGNLAGEWFYFKEGGGGGFHCEMRLYPHRGIATVGMTNETSSKIKDYLDKLDPMFFTK